MADAPRNTTGHVSVADEPAVRQIIADSVLKLWDVVNQLTRLRPTSRERYRVTIFGSARAQPGTVAYDETRRLAAALAEMGCDIVSGGGPGLMQAANEGAASVGAAVSSVGIRIELPFEQHGNAFVTDLYEHRTFFTRLHQFVLSSDAFVVAPGGVGTLLELLMVWQLLQVEHLTKTPLILVGRMWPGLIDWARETMLQATPSLVSAGDLDIPVCVATADEAIEHLKTHHAEWLAESARARETRTSRTATE